MSFRARLTSFFVVIVVVPMLAVGALVYSLISASERAKADARVDGLLTAAGSLYASEQTLARNDAQTIARSPALLAGGALPAKVSAIAAQTGLARVEVMIGARTVADHGDRSAVAPGVAKLSLGGRGPVATVTVSELTAAQYVQMVSGSGVAAVVQERKRTLATTLVGVEHHALPRRGRVTIRGIAYRTGTLNVRGFSGSVLTVTILSSLAATSTSVGTTRLVAAIFIVGFLLLAFAFSLLASRALQGQVSRFLEAARRLAGGDFSSQVPTEGQDEFAALGQEFNNMSRELERRLDELSQERMRLRQSNRRLGETLASNLDRPALLELVLQTAVDAVQADCGRIRTRTGTVDELVEATVTGSMAGFGADVEAAEREALQTRDIGEHGTAAGAAVSVPLGLLQSGGRAHGVLTVARRGPPFNDDERGLLRSLAAQAALALENVDLHFQVRRQAVTDELTGLANHGRFQELLGTEIEQVRRYHHPLGLIMLDIDDFKSINDNYGHPQGDHVLAAVARVVRENSREADTPARYGGEEMALILPHTDLDGAYAIAERVRSAIEDLRIPRTDAEDMLRVTASIGVAATRDGTREALITEADAALYDAKRRGKNRTVRAPVGAANVSTGE